MSATSWVSRYYQEVDGGNLEGAMRFWTDAGRMLVGNGEPVVGKDALAQTIHGFLTSFEAVRHEFREVWEPTPGVIVFEALFHFDRRDGRAVSVPAAGVCRVQDEKWLEQRVYLDATPAFASS